jgi:ferredoxin-NADP reductase
MERTTLPGRLSWRIATVVETLTETPRAATLVLEVPNWPGHQPGQHLDIRLTAEDGYQAQRSYSIASAPEDSRVAITVERLDDGEVSPYLVDDVRVGDQVELRGPIGGYFTWEVAMSGPLLLVAGGSGIVPLMSMVRHRAVSGNHVPVRLLYSSRSYDDIIYRTELKRLAADDAALEVLHTLTRSQPPDWRGYRRRIDGTLLTEVSWQAADRPLTFICGPTALVESVATYCIEQGYAPERVKTERFGPTGS